MHKLWILPALLIALAGCETAQGFGQDVENTGEFISEEAQEVDAGM